MLVYSIVFAELAFLYTVFWYIFLHEPRPFKIDEDLWGTTNKIAIRSDPLPSQDNNDMPSCLQLNFYLRKSAESMQWNANSEATVANPSLSNPQSWQVASVPIISHFFLLLSKSLEDLSPKRS